MTTFKNVISKVTLIVALKMIQKKTYEHELA